MEPTESSMPPAMMTTAMPTAMMAVKLVSLASWARFWEWRNLFFSAKAGARSPSAPTVNARCRPVPGVRSNSGVRTVPVKAVSSRPSARMTSSRPLSWNFSRERRSDDMGRIKGRPAQDCTGEAVVRQSLPGAHSPSSEGYDRAAALFLAVVGAGAVLALEMLVKQLRLDGLQLRLQSEGQQRQVGAALGGDSDLHSHGHGHAPGEGRVAVDEHPGAVERIERLETLDDDVAGLPFVGAAGDFLERHLPGDGNLTEEIIRVRRAEDRHGPAGLRKGRGVRAVRVKLNPSSDTPTHRRLYLCLKPR